MYVRYRSHALQLCLVNASKKKQDIKRVLNLCHKIFTFFENSPLRTNELNQIQLALYQNTRKLIKPIATRWFSYDRSFSIILETFASLCFTFKNLYKESGTLFCDAGGILVEMRKKSNVYIIIFLSKLFKVLSILSKISQSPKSKISTIYNLVQNTIVYLENFDYTELTDDYTEKEHDLLSSGIVFNIDDDFRIQKYNGIFAGFLYQIMSNLKSRFGDPFICLVDLESIFIDRSNSPNFQNLSKLF